MARRLHPTHNGATEGGSMKAFRTPDQIVRIYHLDQQGRSGQKIAQEEGISPGSVATTLTQLKKYLKGKDRGQSKRSYAYRQAARVIRRDKQSEPPQVNTAPQSQAQTTKPDDSFAFLRRSYGRF